MISPLAAAGRIRSVDLWTEKEQVAYLHRYSTRQLFNLLESLRLFDGDHIFNLNIFEYCERQERLNVKK